MVLTDYRLPGALNGIELVAAMTAAAAASGIPLIRKPVQPARLRALIAHLAATAEP